MIQKWSLNETIFTVDETPDGDHTVTLRSSIKDPEPYTFQMQGRPLTFNITTAKNQGVFIVTLAQLPNERLLFNVLGHFNNARDFIVKSGIPNFKAEVPEMQVFVKEDGYLHIEYYETVDEIHHLETLKFKV